MKQYTLVVGHHFSLANETDSDVMTDYFPGIWGIKTKVSAIKFSKELLAAGHEITITNYNDAKYFALSNELIKELGLKQELFPETEAIPESKVTDGGPRNLSDLKRKLVPGLKVRVTNYLEDGTVRNERETSVLRIQTNAVVLEKTLGSGTPSWMEYGKASDWVFENGAATDYRITREGKAAKSTKITY